MAAEAKRVAGLTRNVLVLGTVSFLTDISSEMSLTLLPLFLANVLGVKTSIIGLIEGIAEATASLLKLVSGWLSDWLGRRKSLVVLGYGLSATAKPFLAIATSWPQVLLIRFADRVGKGIRTSPRDALVADSSPVETRGRSFGFHRAADTAGGGPGPAPPDPAGAVTGLALAALVVYLTQKGAMTLSLQTYRLIVLLAMIPGFLAVALALFFVTEIRPFRKEASAPFPLSLKGFDRRFLFFLLSVVLFTLGNSSDAFLILRAQNVGLNVLQITLMLVGFNVLYSLVSTPAGEVSDRIGRRKVIITGWMAYALIYLGFALAFRTWHIWLLYVAYGLYYGLTEGVARALVADLVPSPQRASAYGLYHSAVGIMAFPSSFIAGVLWQAFSPAAPFYFGAAMAGLASILLVVAVR